MLQKTYRGRLTHSTATEVTLSLREGLESSELHTLPVQSTNDKIPLGSWVEWKAQELKLLVPNQTGEEKGLRNRFDNPNLQLGLLTRIKIRKGVQTFFESRDYLEVQTPLLVENPGMEAHIRPYTVSAYGSTSVEHFLPTSPENQMKRLLVSGLPRIFQMAQAFRFEPESSTHHPEFTLLEWYRRESDLFSLIQETFELLSFLHTHLKVPSSSLKISKEPRITTVNHLLEKEVATSLKDLLNINTLKSLLEKESIHFETQESWNDLFFRLWLNRIEPKLDTETPLFVTDYPACMAANAETYIDHSGIEVAKRFEVYWKGIELANAFQEVTDPEIQRARFVKEMTEREESYGPSFPKTPIPENYLKSLKEGLPPVSGIALGIDRLIMLLAGLEDIRDTLWLPASSSKN